MLIGVPKEIKTHEYRVGLTPAGVRELSEAGHRVLVQSDCASAIGLSDADYRGAGAELVDSAAVIYARAELIVKVKEPQPQEYPLLREGQALFTFLHLAPDPLQTRALLDAGVSAIAYETITDAHGSLPLLAPMSEVAGRLAIQAAAHCLEIAQGGRGVLLGGVPGVDRGRVLVLGGGVVGLNAARMAIGLGAQVTVLDRSLARLRYIDDLYGERVHTLCANSHNLEAQLAQADAVIGAVLVPGAATPKLIRRAHLARMPRGAVLVDVAIDQGGCAETSRPTTYRDPSYLVDGIVHYCVANMPGGAARTATHALTNATAPFVLALANKGVKGALLDDPHFLRGLNVHRGALTCQAVANAFGGEFVDPLVALKR